MPHTIPSALISPMRSAAVPTVFHVCVLYAYMKRPLSTGGSIHGDSII